jgi:hypothetical protein
VLDFLFRVTDLSREDEIESTVTDIVSAAKRRRVDLNGDEDGAPKKLAKTMEDVQRRATAAESVTQNPRKTEVAAPSVVEEAESRVLEKPEQVAVEEESVQTPAAAEPEAGDDDDKEEDGLSMSCPECIPFLANQASMDVLYGLLVIFVVCKRERGNDICVY